MTMLTQNSLLLVHVAVVVCTLYNVHVQVVSYGLGGHYEPHHDYFGSMANFEPANSKVPILAL